MSSVVQTVPKAASVSVKQTTPVMKVRVDGSRYRDAFGPSIKEDIEIESEASVGFDKNWPF